jgi:broad specificity phosphatase PhoE
MRIYLIRHAEKIIGSGDVGITSHGKLQALLTGKYLKNLQINRLYSSLQKRAIETAKVIGKSIRKPFNESKLLNERISFGEVAKLTYEQYTNLCSRSTLNRSFILPNGETSIKAGERFELFIQKHKKIGKNLIIVSHSGVIADYLRNIFPINLLKKKSEYFSKFYSVRNCSITEIEVTNLDKKLIRLDSIVHLKLN